MIKILSEKTIQYVELQVQADPKSYKDVCNYALTRICSDKEALFNYGFLMLVKQGIKKGHKCLSKKSSRR